MDLGVSWGKGPWDVSAGTAHTFPTHTPPVLCSSRICDHLHKWHLGALQSSIPELLPAPVRRLSALFTPADPLPNPLPPAKAESMFWGWGWGRNDKSFPVVYSSHALLWFFGYFSWFGNFPGSMLKGLAVKYYNKSALGRRTLLELLGNRISAVFPDSLPTTHSQGKAKRHTSRVPTFTPTAMVLGG